MEHKQKLPETFVISSILKEEDARLRELQRTAQKGYRELLKMRDLVLPDSMDELTPEWLDSVVNNKLKAVAQMDYLPDEERERICKQWKMVQNFGARAIRDIQAFLNDVGRNNVTLDKELQTLYITDITGMATQRATREVPPLAKDYWKQVAHILREIEQLRKFEDDNEIIPQSLAMLSSISMETYLSAWCNGSALVNHQFDHLPNTYHLKNSDFDHLIL